MMNSKKASCTHFSKFRWNATFIFIILPHILCIGNLLLKNLWFDMMRKGRGIRNWRCLILNLKKGKNVKRHLEFWKRSRILMKTWWISWKGKKIRIITNKNWNWKLNKLKLLRWRKKLNKKEIKEVVWAKV